MCSIRYVDFNESSNDDSLNVDQNKKMPFRDISNELENVPT
jgi:hypothetical protein